MLKYAFMKNFTTLILLILIAAVGKAQNDTLWQRNLEDVVIKENRIVVNALIKCRPQGTKFNADAFTFPKYTPRSC